MEKRGKEGLELGGYLLEDLVKVHPHSRVSGLWIRRPVTPALSDRPHCFNLPPKQSFLLFSSLFSSFSFFPFSFSVPFSFLSTKHEHTNHASFVLPSFVVVLLVPDGLFPTRLTHDPRTVLSGRGRMAQQSAISPLGYEKIRSTLRRFLARNIGGEQRYEPPRRLPRRD